MLVDYGSDSDSGSPPPPAAPPPAAAPAAASTSKLNLPPPASSAVAAALRKKKAPTRFTIDSASSGLGAGAGDDDAAEQPPAAKKPRLGAEGGLAAMLPAPKSTKAVSETRSLGTPGSSSSKGGLASLLASKPPVASSRPAPKPPAPAVSTTSASAAGAGANDDEDAQEEEEDDAGGIDFFGIGSSTAKAGTSKSASTAKTKAATGPSISSAPKVAVSKQASAADPFPGFEFQRGGIWRAKTREAYDDFVAAKQGTGFDLSMFRLPLEDELAMAAEGEDERPKDFDASAVDQANELDEEARRREWDEKKPQDLHDPAKEAAANATKPKVNARLATGRARHRHQLSSLLSEAAENRAELEERIAAAKASRKSGGSKYGF